MHWTDPVVLIAALGGGVGIGHVIRALATVLQKLRAGVSPREGKRRIDIVQQRDEALARLDKERMRASAEQARADWADANRQVAVENEQRAREHAAALRVQLIEQAGLTREELPAWPEMERTIPREQFLRVRRGQEGIG
ncbi:hypothetical protein Csp2054_14355 [Curtobacterium sp. 'Ferrero']|uniref:hypothetical protein n=1 Tax=Curtobacterium sp. 'Ferrero' TaxID=2033654 RepID=UPI000BC50332|nr:hypothetical protein [Curtobacterium sp. 'Ferrero']PCN47021.1 hypothetical protein Csp2054_14355 [Curtobacterium sp. 'Ferrero']